MNDILLQIQNLTYPQFSLFLLISIQNFSPVKIISTAKLILHWQCNSARKEI